jgi:hypothetical protein
MKTYFNIILIIIAAFLLMRCEFLEDFEKGNGEIVIEKRSTGDFDGLSIAGNFEVILEKSDQPNVEINTDENLLDFIDTEVRAGILSVTQEKKLISKSKIRIIINYQELNEIRAMGAALIKNEDYLIAEDLEIVLEGAGAADLKIISDKLKVELSGAGVISLAGEVREQELNLMGAGKLEAFDLDSEECDVSVGGLGGAEIYVTGKLNAIIEGVGSIKYDGQPQDINTEIKGLGRIKPVNH